MKQITYQGYITDVFAVTRTSKNTYRIVRYDNVYHVVHSQQAVFDFMEQHEIYSFEILEEKRAVMKKTVISD